MQLNDEEDKEPLKEQVDHWHEITCPNVFAVRLDEACPGLLRRVQGWFRAHVALHRSLGDREPELEQLPVDALGTPEIP